MPSQLNLTFRQNPISIAPVLVNAGNFNLISWNLINPDGIDAYLKLYNASAANQVTVGTTVPIKTLFVPAEGTALLSNESFLQNGFVNGIVAAVTTGVADSNTGVPATGLYVELQYAQNS